MVDEFVEERVLEFIRLGMDFHTACLASGISEEDEDELLEDDIFQRKVLVNNATAEHDLLKRHDRASKTAEIKGGTSALQWKLEKINPKRYSNKDKGDNDIPSKVIINMFRGKKDKEEK